VSACKLCRGQDLFHLLNEIKALHPKKWRDDTDPGVIPALLTVCRRGYAQSFLPALVAPHMYTLITTFCWKKKSHEFQLMTEKMFPSSVEGDNSWHKDHRWFTFMSLLCCWLRCESSFVSLVAQWYESSTQLRSQLYHYHQANASVAVGKALELYMTRLCKPHFPKPCFIFRRTELIADCLVCWGINLFLILGLYMSFLNFLIRFGSW
jgi:hypothetical protein